MHQSRCEGQNKSTQRKSRNGSLTRRGKRLTSFWLERAVLPYSCNSNSNLNIFVELSIVSVGVGGIKTCVVDMSAIMNVISRLIPQVASYLEDLNLQSL